VYTISSVQVWVNGRKEMVMALVTGRLLSFAQWLMHYRCTLWFERFDISLVERVDEGVGRTSRQHPDQQ
jgi:hypothetical protein